LKPFTQTAAAAASAAAATSSELDAFLRYSIELCDCIETAAEFKLNWLYCLALRDFILPNVDISLPNVDRSNVDISLQCRFTSSGSLINLYVKLALQEVASDYKISHFIIYIFATTLVFFAAI
jgi:hypothetical protein